MSISGYKNTELKELFSTFTDKRIHVIRDPFFHVPEISKHDEKNARETFAEIHFNIKSADIILRIEYLWEDWVHSNGDCHIEKQSEELKHKCRSFSIPVYHNNNRKHICFARKYWQKISKNLFYEFEEFCYKYGYHPIERRIRFMPGKSKRQVLPRPYWTRIIGLRVEEPFLLSGKDTAHLQNIIVKGDGWPSEIEMAYAISIRKARWIKMCQRLGPWKGYVKLFPGIVVGQNNEHEPEPPSEPIPAQLQKLRLSKGQLGVYMSHVKLWTIISRSSDNLVLILEDDAGLYYHEQIAKRFRHLFDQIRRYDLKFDIFYLGNLQHPLSGDRLCTGIRSQVPWDGLYCYLITPTGAQKLLANIYKQSCAIDVYVALQYSSYEVRALRAEPRFCFVTPEKSDINFGKKRKK
jgi:hypothetical protein